MTEQLRLLEPIQIGDLCLPNRIFMAPLTRCRASGGNVPNALNAEYYAQRASAGLIITEGSQVSAQAVGIAEAAYRESLKLEPDNKIAKGELDYIARLRAGEEKQPGGITAPGMQPKTQ